MPLPLTSLLRQLDLSLRVSRQILLFSDFDGTLTPICMRPSECQLDPAVRRILSALAEHPCVSMAIVSGRQVDDLRAKVNVAGVTYAGNHGLEIDGPGIHFRESQAACATGHLDCLVMDLVRAISPFRGAWVEHKGFTASVHFREVAPSEVSRLITHVQNASEPSIASRLFVLRTGKAVLELRPAVEWNKGSAVCWLAGKFASVDQKPLVLYFGDDETDEDVFAVLPVGVTVKVGSERPTLARYSAHDPKDVGWFLEWLLSRIVRLAQVSHQRSTMQPNAERLSDA